MKNKVKDKKPVGTRPPGGFRQALFWDVDPKTIDPEKHAVYIIERVLDFGNKNDSMPKTNKASWEEIKKYFQREVPRIAKNLLLSR